MPEETISTADIDRDRFAETLARALDERGLTQSDLARTLGVTQPTISDYVNGKKTPSRKNLEQLIRLLDLEPADLVAPAEPPLADDVVLIPVRGEGASRHIYGDNDRDERVHAFSRSELLRLTNRNPERLASFIVSGDSLAPEILPNSVIVYWPQEQFTGDGLYVLKIDGTELAKRVQVLPGGALELLPVNAAYKPELLLPVPNADTRNTYRSQRTELVTTIQVLGKIVAYAKPA